MTSPYLSFVQAAQYLCFVDNDGAVQVQAFRKWLGRVQRKRKINKLEPIPIRRVGRKRLIPTEWVDKLAERVA